MSADVDQVDWAQVERRGRRRYLAAAPAIAAWQVAWALLHQGEETWQRVVMWWLVAVTAAVGLVGLLLVHVHPRLRARDAEHHRVVFAVRRHLDPGPGLREKADRYADRMSGNALLWWVVVLALPGAVSDADWDQPAVTVPSLVAVLAGFGVAAVRLRRLGRAADRWCDDPPGPDRSPAAHAPGRAPRRYTGRRVAVLAVVAVLGLYGIFVLLALGTHG